MTLNYKKAEKHNEELAETEQELAAQEPEEVEQPQEVQEVEEQTTPEESAPTEEEETQDEESPQTPKVKEEESEEAEAGAEEEADFTKEEWDALGEKTKRQMTKLRQKARKAEKIDKLAKVYQPLEEVAKDIKKEAETEKSEPNLPWREGSTQKAGMWAANLLEDISYAEREYPELNPDNAEGYDEELTAGILKDFRKMRKSDPDVRLKDMVDTRMSAVRKAEQRALERVRAAQKVKEEQEKQKATEAPPATVSPPKKKITIGDKVARTRSIDELEKLEREIGVSDRYK